MRSHSLFMLFSSFTFVPAVFGTTYTTLGPEPMPQGNFDAETQKLKSKGMCRVWLSDTPDNTCVEYCQQTNQTASGDASCVPMDVSGGNGTGPVVEYFAELDPNGKEYLTGNCSCAAVGLFDDIANAVMQSLPDMMSIGCEIMWDAFQSVLELALDAIPEDDLLEEGMETAVQVAKTIKENGGAATNFLSWIQPCGSNNYTQQVDNIFNPLANTPGVPILTCLKKGGGCKDQVGGKILPKPKGAGMGGGHGPPPRVPIPSRRPKKVTETGKRTDKISTKTTASDHSTPSSKSTHSSQSSSSSQSSPSTSAAPGSQTSDQGASKTQKSGTTASHNTTAPVPTACAFGDLILDARGTKRKCTFNDPLHVTTTTSTVSTLTTPVITCPRIAGQACYNYRSIMSVHTNTPDMYRWTCGATASNTRSVGFLNSYSFSTKDGPKTYSPKGVQHEYQWFAGVDDKLRCERDEWPPAYFMPKKLNPNMKQWIRYIPQEDNGAGGKIWQGFCNLKSSDTVKTLDAKTVSSKGKDGRTTTTTSVKVEVPQKVFMISHFDVPDLPDDGLSANPCWPSQYIPDDPGFALMTNDPWYARNKKQALATRYTSAPPSSLSPIISSLALKNTGKNKPKTKRAVPFGDTGNSYSNGTNPDMRAYVELIKRQHSSRKVPRGVPAQATVSGALATPASFTTLTRRSSPDAELPKPTGGA